LDDDVVTLLDRENRRANEPMKQTVNRILRTGLIHASKPGKPGRFIVQPLDLGITRDQWKAWEGKKIEEILEEAERPTER
jgi:hypothetical protein